MAAFRIDTASRKQLCGPGEKVGTVPAALNDF
jgi:hypothetical protein